MKEVLTFLTAVVILAIAQTLTPALGIVLLIFALMGVVAFPARTFGLIASLGLLALALKAPAACVVMLGAIGVAAALYHRARRQVGPPGKQTVPMLTYAGDKDRAPPTR